MREGANIVLAAAARFYTPLIVLFALVLLITRPAGAGVGFIAGGAFVLAIIVHALVFGAGAARAAAPPWLMRALAASGLVAAVVGASGPVLFAPELIEGGLFVVTAAGGALVIAALFGRAPTMRDEAL
jgi:hypothetical protein